MARAANGPDLGGPLRLNERTANNVFSGWTSPTRPLMLKKLQKFFC